MGSRNIGAMASIISLLAAIRSACGLHHEASLSRHNSPPYYFTGPRPWADVRSEGLTVMMNTYERPAMLKSAVEHYYQCSAVASVRVVWCEKGSTPATDNWDLAAPRSHTRLGSSRRKNPSFDEAGYKRQRLQFDMVPDSLNSRFLPLPGITTDAVFAVDDDIRVPCRDLKLALHAWAMSPTTLVGFFPRLHTLAPAPATSQSKGDLSPRSKNEALPLSSTAGATTATAAAPAPALWFEYHSWWYVWWYGRYSMVLTKAAILHRTYLTIYSAEAPSTTTDQAARNAEHIDDGLGSARSSTSSSSSSRGAHAPLRALPTGVREYVDAHMNCEDVAMQLLVSNVSGLPPIYVRGAARDAGVFGGISTRGGHMNARSDCLNDMMALFSGDLTSTKPPSSGYSSTSRSSSGDSGRVGKIVHADMLPSSRMVVGPASSWRSNQPATWMEFIATDLPVPVALQVALLLALVALLGRMAVALVCCGRRWRLARLAAQGVGNSCEKGLPTTSSQVELAKAH